MKKVIVLIGALFLLLQFASIQTVSAISQEEIRARALEFGPPSLYFDGVVTQFNSTVTVDQRGNATIVEKIYVYFPNPRRGIYRWIPQKVTVGSQVLEQPISLKRVTYQKVSARNEGSHPIGRKYSKEESTRAYLVVRIGDPDVYLEGAYEYTIEYSMKNAIRFQENTQELYLNITGPEWKLPILDVTASVSPVAENLPTVCYTGLLGSVEQRCRMEQKDNVLSIVTTTDKKQAVQGLTIGVQYPQDTFIGPTKFELLLEKILPWTPFLGTLIALAYAYSVWSKFGKDTRIRTIPPLYIPTKTMENTNLSVLHSLLSMKPLPLMATAELIRLAEKGYLTIRYEKKKLTLELSEQQQKTLPEYLNSQPQSLNTLITTITKNFQAATQVSALKNVHAKMAEANNLAKKEFETAHFIVSESVRWRNIFIAAAVLLAISSFISFAIIGETLLYRWYTISAALLVTALIFFLFSMIMLQRTKEGDELTRDLLGLKRYIKAAELKRLEFFNNPKKMIAHFEQILPYAIILKLDKRWTKEFSPILEQLHYEPAWLVSDMPLTRSLPVTYAAMSSSMAASMTNLSTPPNSGSSSFGGGGGFSGGGSGGGGGGSW